MSFTYRDETQELNGTARKDAGGYFIQLPDGITHYEMSPPLPFALSGAAGRVDGVVPSYRDPAKTKRGEGPGVREIVLIHGFSVPYFIYDPTFEFLEQEGFRVLRYDLFGRGFSDRPDTNYNLDLFLKQLADLLDALRITGPVNLIGLSMGGPIAAAFTTRHPLRVHKLVLIDPIGVKPIALTPMLKALKMPVVGELGFSLAGSGSMVRNIASDFFDPEMVEHFQARYKVQMRYKGFKRAILSTIRNDMLGSFMDVYQRLGKMNKQVLLFWGRNDTTAPYEHSDDLCAVLPNIRFHAIENCGHIPHYEKPDEVNPILLEFLRDNGSQIS
ncbi:MAG: alpha/beta hydrolase [Anaerolineae bacterium]|nr:alpha/beta hydrolase [Anaerolineae bacterium]MCI0608366.1 alpha/beta hydrolase [Anaerolineae bacterium]